MKDIPELILTVDPHLEWLATQARYPHHAGERGLLLRLVVESDEAEPLAESTLVKNNWGGEVW